MTIQQEAHNLIDVLTEESVRAIVNVMIKMKSRDDTSIKTETTVGEMDSTKHDKMKHAYNRVLEIRHHNNQKGYNDIDYETARKEAVIK